jgi:hypothetical protein
MHQKFAVAPPAPAANSVDEIVFSSHFLLGHHRLPGQLVAAAPEQPRPVDYRLCNEDAVRTLTFGDEFKASPSLGDDETRTDRIK